MDAVLQTSTTRATGFEIQVLDDSTDETTDRSRRISSERYADGFQVVMPPQPIFYLHRTRSLRL